MLSEKDRERLISSEELFSRKARDCEAKHENVYRDIHGNALRLIQLLSQCPSDKRHFGCPHFLRESMETIVWTIRTTFLDNTPRAEELVQFFEDMEGKTQQVDDAIRIARIGGREENPPRFEDPIPNTCDAQERARDPLETFNKHREALESAKSEILQKIRILLQTEKL